MLEIAEWLAGASAGQVIASAAPALPASRSIRLDEAVAREGYTCI